MAQKGLQYVEDAMTSSFRSTFACLAAGASALALATPALAQDTGASEADSGVIVVTAQKREQNLQDVPLAISAIGEEKLQQLQVSDARDLSGLAPNLTITQGTVSGSSAVISIRGITTPASETFGLDTANGVYVDGIYIARSGASGLDVADIARVEVLRGPQGTLFGRNTTGGAISFISREPDKDFGVRGEVGVGNYNSWNAKGSIDSGELFGALRSTISFAHRQRDGFVDNILEPRDSRDPGARKSDAFRAAFRVDLGGTGYIRYIFDWAKVHSNPYAFQLTNTSNGAARPPLNVDGNLVVQTQQAPVAQYLAAATFLEPGCAALAVPQRAYRDTVCQNHGGRSIDKNWGHNLQISNDFGGFNIKATGGYRSWDSSYGDPDSDLDGIGTIRGPLFSNATLFNGMPVSLLQFIPTIPAAARPFIAASPVPTTTSDLFYGSNVRKHDQFSSEIEISGTTDHLDWIVGGFYFWEKGSEDNPQNSGFILDTNSIFLANFGALGPSFVAANPARYRLVFTPAKLVYTTTAESKALYGQMTFYPGGRDSGLSLTAGGRYTWDSKAMTRSQNGAVPLANVESGRQSFSKFTWNLMARYEINPDISVYGRAATGYRSGGFNASDPALPGTTTIPHFNEESVTSFELGLKSQLFDRRLTFNLAAYRNMYDDLAVIVPVLTGTGTFQSRIVNAGKVNYTGIEADFNARITDNFSIDGSVGYVDINTKQLIAGQPVVATNPVVNIASVARNGYTSPLTANIAANVGFPLGWGDAELRVRVGYTHEDGRYSFNNSISSPFNEAIKGDARNLIDAQIVVDRMPLAGGEARFMLWGKNLTNSHDLVRGIDFGPLGYAGGYFADPRTFGATLGFQF